MEDQLLSSALEYSNQGYRIFPIHTPNENGCSCNDPDCSSIGKHPRTPAGLKDATQDVKTIKNWWRKWPDANIGIVTGGDFFVLDVDEDGVEELRKHPRLPKTLEAETGGGGRHLFFLNPAGEQIRNKVRFLPGLDIRGDGGYVVAPPSMHESGRQYTWKNECKMIVAPDWLIEAIRNNKKTDSKVSALDRAADMIFEGQRNDTLLRKGCSILAKGLKRVDIPILIRGWNQERCSPPLNDAEVEKIIESVLSYDETGDLLSIIESSVIGSLDFMKKKIHQPECVIDPWLTDGSLSMIYAPRGVGKTWLCLIIAVAVTRKDYKQLNIGPWNVLENAGTLYVDGEMSEFYLQKRVKKLTLGLGGKKNLGCNLEILSANNIANKYRQQIKISDPQWRDALYNYLAKRKEYQLLILDNIASLTPEVDENLKKEWDPINQWLLSLRHMGVAVIFIHHTGKSGQQRGTSGRERCSG